jgi:biotin transport system substrate-specific component
VSKPVLLQLAPRIDAGIAGRLAAIALGTALLAISAKVQVPFWPVPMTLQTMVVLLIGATFGGAMAGATLLAYLVEGALGLPVFASGAGLAYLAGPTGGYLVGFLLAATAVGFMADRGLLRTLWGAFAAMAVAEVLIFGVGVVWLGNVIGAEKAIAAGLVPFLPAEALKMTIAAVVAARLARRVA